MTLLLVVISVLVLTLAYPLRLYLAQQSQIDKLASRNDEQRKRVEVLKTKVAGYDDPAWTQEEARKRLHWVQPGEKLLRAPASTALPTTGPAAATGTPAGTQPTSAGAPVAPR